MGKYQLHIGQVFKYQLSIGMYQLNIGKCQLNIGLMMWVLVKYQLNISKD